MQYNGKSNNKYVAKKEETLHLWNHLWAPLRITKTIEISNPVTQKDSDNNVNQKTSPLRNNGEKNTPTQNWKQRYEGNKSRCATDEKQTRNHKTDKMKW